MKTKPKIEIDLAKVEALAALGDTQEEIANALGISRTTLQSRIRENELFKQAIKRGQQKGITQIENVLFKAARDGNMTACIFYLKNRCPERWNEKSKLDISSSQPVMLKVIDDLKK